MFWWYAKIAISIALIVHSVLGQLGFSGFMPQPPAALALTLILAGGTLNLYHYLLIRRVNPDISDPQVLVTTGGLYGRCRHPMYFCDLVWCLGVALYPVSSVSLLLYTALIPAILFLSEQEDHAIRTRHPEAFGIWKKRTGRLIPVVGKQA